LGRWIEALSNEDVACQRLRQIPGVGPLVATATIAAIGNGAAFHKGLFYLCWTAVEITQDGDFGC
jgi:transposase